MDPVTGWAPPADLDGRAGRTEAGRSQRGAPGFGRSRVDRGHPHALTGRVDHPDLVGDDQPGLHDQQDAEQHDR